MKLISNVSVSTYESWERDHSDRTQLTVIRSGADVQIAAVNMFGDSALFVMSADAAGELGADILRLLSSKGSRDGIVQEDLVRGRVECENDQPLELVVRPTNRGEPYEEGVLLQVRNQQESTNPIYLELSRNVASKLGKELNRS